MMLINFSWIEYWDSSQELKILNVRYARRSPLRLVDLIQLIDMIVNNRDRRMFDGHRLSRNQETIQWT